MTHVHVVVVRSIRNAVEKINKMKIKVINKTEMRSIMSIKDAILAVKEAAIKKNMGQIIEL